MQKIITLGITCFLLLMISGCANQPAAFAQRYDFSQSTSAGSPFIHQLFFNPAFTTSPKKTHGLLHVYIEGDGSPFFQATQISANPTPSDPLMLKLMHTDPSPALYLGRPCYFSTNDPACPPIWWTHWRYHEDVVSSMIKTLDPFQDRFEGFILIGFSGGGTLAMLMAEKLQHTHSVITLAGNLNTTKWEQHHQYTTMKGSLNPALRAPLANNIKQIHFAGGQDNNVLAQWIEEVANQQHQAEFRLLKNYDHNCCWLDMWPTTLKAIAKEEITLEE